MKMMKNLIILGFISIMTFFVGCESGGIDPNNPPSLQLDTYELNIDGGGGNIPLFYALKNPVKGGKFDVVSDVDWVSLKEVTSTTIVLHIEPSNIDEERFSLVGIKYTGMDKLVRVSILQDKQFLLWLESRSSRLSFLAFMILGVLVLISMPSVTG